MFLLSKIGYRCNIATNERLVQQVFDSDLGKILHLKNAKVNFHITLGLISSKLSFSSRLNQIKIVNLDK